jgi:hypothetical protein
VPRIALSFVFLLSVATGLSAQVGQPAPKDQQAVGILNQALNAAGGVAALSAVTDYTATGGVTYYGDSSVAATVTLRALNLNQFRQDTNLSTGTRTFAVNNGSVTTQNEAGVVRHSRSQAPISASGFILPVRYVASALNWQPMAISYQGLTQMDGHSVHQIRLRLNLSATAAASPPPMDQHTIDFYIDASTFQVVMSQEMLAKGVLHQTHYSDYQVVNGLLVPFAIRESYFGQPMSLIQLNQVSFNTGLQTSVFQLQ